MNLVYIDDPKKKRKNQTSKILKFEFEVLGYCMIPFLKTIDMIRLQRVSKGFKEVVEIGAKESLRQTKRSVSASETIWNFINPRFQTVLLKKNMLERFSELTKRGLKKNFRSEMSTFCNDEASVCVLLFFLRQRKPRILQHMLHCIVPRWGIVNRRKFRTMYLKIEMYFARQRFTKPTIKRKGIQIKRNSMSKTVKPELSVSISHIIESKLPDVQTLTEQNLEQHNRQSLKRKRSLPKREIKKPKLYADEYQKDVVVNDDFKEYSDGSPTPANVKLEERSVDSQSEGSLVDFIVKSDKEDNGSVSDRTETDVEVDDGKTETESSCNTSDLSGIFSDEEDEC